MTGQERVNHHIGGELTAIREICAAIVSSLPESAKGEVIDKLLSPKVEPRREFLAFIHEGDKAIETLNSAARDYISQFIKDVS